MSINPDVGVTQAHEKCVMKMKERKNDSHVNFFDDRKDIVWLLQKLGVTDVNELQVNNSLHTKGTICLVNGRMGAIKLAMAGT